MSSLNWKSVVSDTDERKVFLALEDPGYTWRTIGAVARQAGLDEGKVLEIITRYSPRLVRRSRQTSASGRPLVGLIERVGV